MTKYLDAKQIQEMLGISRPMAYKLLNELSCPTIHIGRCVRVRESDFCEWLLTRFGSGNLVVQ